MTYYFQLAFYENISEWAIDYFGIADPFEVRIPIGITNTHSLTLWFKAELDSPPAGYSDYSLELGSITSGASDYKIFNFKRSHPVAKVTDSLALKVTAYLDSSYTVELCNDTLSASLYLFSHNALTLVDHDTFDTEGDLEGWVKHGSSAASISQSSVCYMSAPYSLSGGAGLYQVLHGATKNFTIGSVSEAFLTLHWQMRTETYGSAGPLQIDDKSCIPSTVFKEYSTTKWYRFCLKIPTNKVVKVELGMNAAGGASGIYWDDIWIVTNP